MPYSSFTIKKVQKEFSVEIRENTGLFSSIESREIGNHLKETLLLDYQVFLSDKNKGGGRVNR
jgi:hypothetical protein